MTIRDSSCCHWMAVGIRRMRGRLSAARSCVCNAAKCVRLRRRGCDGFVLFTHSAWVWRASPVAIRWLGGDLRSGQRREYHPNMPAPALRREWPPFEASHRPRQCNGTFGGLCVKVRKVRPKSAKRPQSPSEKSDNSRFSRFMIRAKTRWAEQRPHRGAGCEEEDQRHRHRGAAYKEEDRRERHPRHRRSAVRRRRQTQRRRDATDRARPCRAAPTGALPAFRNRSRAITSST